MAAQAGLSLTWLKTPKTGFLLTRLNSVWTTCEKSSSACRSPFAPLHDKITCAPSKDSNQPRHCAQWVAKDLMLLHADSEDSDQTRRMPRLIRVFAGRTGDFVGFVVWRLIWFLLEIFSFHTTHMICLARNV